MAVDPEAVIEDLGHNTAIWVVPAYDACGVASVDGILENSLMLVERNPLGSRRALEREEEPAGGDINCIRGNSGEKRRNDVPGIYPDGNYVCKNGGLGS